jgi:hypothetical protein
MRRCPKEDCKEPTETFWKSKHLNNEWKSSRNEENKKWNENKIANQKKKKKQYYNNIKLK